MKNKGLKVVKKASAARATMNLDIKYPLLEEHIEIVKEYVFAVYEVCRFKQIVITKDYRNMMCFSTENGVILGSCYLSEILA